MQETSLKDTIAAWIAEGLKLGGIQARLSELQQKPMTYMEVRFLLDDLELSIPEKTVEKPVESSIIAALPDETSVSVKLDAIQRPGTIASGSVTFSDSQEAQWQLDEQGRLGFIPQIPGYRPSSEDIAEFQKALQQLIG